MAALSERARQVLGTGLANSAVAKEIADNLDAASAAVSATPGTVVASEAVVVDSNKDITTFRNLTATNLKAGASGTAGAVDVFPATAAKGKVEITTAANAGDTTTTFAFAAQAAARAYSVPDAGADANVVLDAGLTTLAEGKNIAAGTATGTKIGTATSQKFGFWNATPIVQPASAGQAALTDSTTGTPGVTLVDVTVTPTQATINDNFASLANLVNAMRTALVNAGIMKGAA